MPRLGEFEILERMIRAAGLASGEVVVGPGDDAAVLQGGLIVSTDMAVEGVHFRLDWIKPEEVGFRAAAAALSDLSAMGAAPFAVLVSMALPESGKGVRGAKDLGPKIQSGIAEAAARAGAVIVGGDVSRNSSVVVDVVVLGRSKKPVLRSGAEPGDELWVSGALGGAAGAVYCWEHDREPDGRLRAAFTHPPDRSALGLALSNEVATAMIDVSDGLVADGRHLAHQSGVRVVVNEDTVPLPSGLEGLVAEPLKLALQGGEDYELLFTTRPGAAMRLSDLAVEQRVPLTRIGVIEAGAGMVLDGLGGRTEVRAGGGYDHFR